MNEKRIEIVESQAEGPGHAIIRVRDVPQKPTDVRFRIGYRYTNEWLGEDGYWRRSMTMIEPKSWNHTGDVLDLIIGPEIQGSIEANQPVRIEVPSVDAGQVLLWPALGGRDASEDASAPAAMGEGFPSAPNAGSTRKAGPATAAGTPALPPPRPRPNAEEIGQTSAELAASIGAAMKQAGTPRQPTPGSEPRAGAPQMRQTPPPMDGADAPTSTGPTPVRGSAAVGDPDMERLARRRGLTQRRRHPRRQQRPLETEVDAYSSAPSTPPPPARGTAIVPAPHYNIPDDFAADAELERSTRGQPRSSSWGVPLAVLLGLVVGAGGYGLFVAYGPTGTPRDATVVSGGSSFGGVIGGDAAAALAESEARIAALDDQTAALRGQIAELNNRLSQGTAIAPSESDGAALERIAVLETEIITLTAERDDLAAALRQAGDDLENAVAAREAAEQQAVAAQASISALTTDATESQTARDAADARISELEGAVAAADDRATRLATERDGARAEVDALQQQVSALEADRLAAEDERDRSLAQAADFQFRIAELRASIAQLERARDDALQTATDLGPVAAERDTLQAALADAEARAADVETLRAQVSALEAERADLLQTQSDLQAAIDASAAQAATLQTRVSEADTLRADLTRREAQIAAAEAQIAELDAALAQAEAERAQAQAAVTRAADAQRTLDALNASELAREEAIAAADQQRLRADQAEAARDDAVRQLQAAQAAATQSNDAEADISRLTNSLERVRLERDRAEAQLASLQRRLTAVEVAEPAAAAPQTTAQGPSPAEAAVDAAFLRAADFLPTRSIQRSKLRMRLIEGAPIMQAVRGELGLRYDRFDELVDQLCQSLPDQCE